MDDFDRASGRTHRLARRMLATGADAGVTADAFITAGLALWAADTGLHAQARALTAAWSLLREETDRG